MTLDAVADTWVGKQRPRDNHAGAWSLSSDGSPLERSYLAFDMPEAPAGRRLARVELLISAEGSANGGSTDTHAVRVTDSGWTETSLTWRNQPGRGAEAGSLLAPEPGRRYAAELDPARIATAGGRLSLMISTRGADALRFCSREHENAGVRPQLRLTYVADGTP